MDGVAVLLLTFQSKDWLELSGVGFTFMFIRTPAKVKGEKKGTMRGKIQKKS